MTNEVLDRAAGFATCQILASAGGALVGAGAWSLAAGGAGTVPLTLGSLSLLGAGFACQDTPVDGQDPAQRDGCQLTTTGGFPVKNQPNIGQGGAGFPGYVWKEITDIETRESGSGPEYVEVKLRALNVDGSIQGTNPEWQLVELGTTFGMQPKDGESCSITPGEPAPAPPEAFDPIPYTDDETGCTYNVQLVGFVEQYAGGTQDPVYVISGSDALRASGGTVGGCNFSPTVYYGGSGGGGDFGGGDGAPPFPFVPGDGPNGVPNWLDTLGAALAGAGAAIITEVIASAIADAFATPYPGAIYRMVSVCEKDASGEPISEAVEVPIGFLPAPEAQIARLDAIVELLQASKNFKQPVCPDEKPILEGEWRTISFRSESTSPYGKSCLRKRFRYRSQSGIGLGELIDYWKNFTFESGSVVVGHVGSSWGNPQVWATTEDEGKRVIRHAAGEAGIDPDQVGRWTISSSSSSRYGVSSSMSVDTTGGYYWITSRDGSNGRPIVAT